MIMLPYVRFHLASRLTAGFFVVFNGVDGHIGKPAVCLVTEGTFKLLVFKLLVNEKLGSQP